MSSYYEMLKHPLWQKKRLEKLSAANFECESCGNNEKTLHVHHSYYESQKSLWDYPDESLHVLCEDCHRDTHKKITDFKRLLGQLNFCDHEALRGYSLAICAFKNLDDLFEVDDYEVAQGVADWWGLTPELIIHSLTDEKISGRVLLELVAVHDSPRKPWLVRYAARAKTV